MNLDLHTLFLVTIYVEAILGLLLLFVWAQNLALRAVCWWGFAHLLRLASIALFGMYGQIPDLISVDLANALLFTAFAVTWTGARLFDHRNPQYMLLFTGAALWLVACRIPGFTDSLDLRVLLSSGIITAYTWAAAFEFWRGRGEPLVSRWPAIFMLFAHGALYLLRTPLGDLLPWLARNNPLLGSVWLSVLSFEGLLYTIAIAFILLAMAKERAEHRQKTAAMIDPLTGISNRRAFLEEGEEHLKRQVNEPRPTAVMLLDLDNFKSINDRYGHAIGDRVLEIFAEVASSCLRRIDLFGRLGGRRVRGTSARRHARARAGGRRADPHFVCRRHPRRRGAPARRYGEHRRRDRIRCGARSFGAVGTGRSRALSRQGCGAQPDRDRLDRAHPRSRPARRGRGPARCAGPGGGKVCGLTRRHQFIFQGGFARLPAKSRLKGDRTCSTSRDTAPRLSIPRYSTG